MTCHNKVSPSSVSTKVGVEAALPGLPSLSVSATGTGEVLQQTVQTGDSNSRKLEDCKGRSLMDNLIQAILAWGRTQTFLTEPTLVRDTNSTTPRFDSDFTETLRQHLWQMVRSGHPAINHQRNRGYELTLPTGEAVGLSSDYGTKEFHVYYRRATNVSRRIAAKMYERLAEAA